MRHVVPMIWEAVRSEIAAGRPVDVEALCRRFCSMRPELDSAVIRYAVVEAVNGCDSPCPGDAKD